jgi:release factor glutamine methyltransferase
VTVSNALRDASELLSKTCDTARLDAELLMAHALEMDRSEMLLRHMDAPKPEAFDALIDRRAGHEPVAYILGYAEFYGRKFDVGSGVLIPRADSETLIDVAHELAPPNARVLDIGTGSGALLLTFLAERPQAQGIGIDASDGAVRMAQTNAKALDLKHRALIETRDWNEHSWAEGLGQFDLILCNPPYVEAGAALAPNVRDFEPHQALFAGAEGLDEYRVIIPKLGELMATNGVAILEIGNTQAQAVARIAHKHGFATELHHDLGGRPRALTLREGN